MLSVVVTAIYLQSADVWRGHPGLKQRPPALPRTAPRRKPILPVQQWVINGVSICKSINTKSLLKGQCTKPCPIHTKAGH